MYILVLLSVFFFFKQKTAYELRISDWSSDVCSSDLIDIGLDRLGHRADRLFGRGIGQSEAPTTRRRDPLIANEEMLSTLLHCSSSPSGRLPESRRLRLGPVALHASQRHRKIS